MKWVYYHNLSYKNNSKENKIRLKQNKEILPGY